MRTVTTISSVKRASEARRARRAVPLVKRALFQHPLGTYVPTRGYAPRSHAPCAPALPAPPRPRAPTLPAPRPHPGLTPKISHAIHFLDNSTTATNVAIPTTRFHCLKDMRGNCMRDCWETTTQRPTPTQRGRDRKTRPRPRRDSRTNQMRKGSFLTSPRPFHHAPKPSVSPALVSGIRIRTSA